MSSGLAGNAPGSAANATAGAGTAMATTGERTDRGVASNGTSSSDAGPGWALRELLKQSGVQEWDPRVIMQLIEFQYRTTHDILLNCKDYAAHDGRTQLTEDDLQLGVQEHLRTTRKPLRSVLTEIQQKINKVPLPPITAASGHGLRLPDARACLTSDNFGRDSVPVTHRNANTAASTASATGGAGDVGGMNGNNAVMRSASAHDRYNVTRVPKQNVTERKTKLFVGSNKKDSEMTDDMDTTMRD